MGAEGFHGRVRDGIGWFGPRYGHQAVDPRRRSLYPGALYRPPLIEGGLLERTPEVFSDVSVLSFGEAV